MILPFTDDEVNYIVSSFDLDHLPRRYRQVNVLINDTDLVALMNGTSTKLGFILYSDNMITVDTTMASLYNSVKYLKKKAIFLNYQYLYPQFKGNSKIRAERVIDYVVAYHKNIFIKNTNIFDKNTYANQLMSYLLSLAYDEEKRVILSIVTHLSDNEFWEELTRICGTNPVAYQILTHYTKIKL